MCFSKRITLSALTSILVTTSSALAETPDVLVSIKPVHSLITGIMQGVGEPNLLLGDAVSPHTYAMRPSDSRKLYSADMVFWVGPSLETFLVKSVSTLDSKTKIISLIEQDGINVLHSRTLHSYKHSNEISHTEELEIDPHFWLDPENAKQTVRIATIALSKADSANKKVYQSNANEMIRALHELDKELREQLRSFKEIPYVVFHDAYQHFEKHYGLNSLAAVTVNPGQTPGAKGIVEMKKLIAEKNVKCVFAEPQFEPSILHAITEGTAVKTGTLDALGSAIYPGPEAYEQIMRGLANDFSNCLKER